MINVDNTEIKELFSKLQRQSPKIYNQAVKNYVGKMAFETKKKSEWVVKTRFKFKNSGTLKRSQRFILYTAPKKLSGEWESEVGSVGNINQTAPNKIGAFWLGKQELGEKVEQKKFKKSVLRSQLMTRVLSPQMKSKQVKKVSSSVLQIPFNNRMGLAIGIKKAKRAGLKYVSSKWGVFQVKPGKWIPKRKNATKIYSFTNKTVTLNRREWLKPATTIISKNAGRYAVQSIDRAFKKFA